jgi:predicted  nucleic acid-binding Zn-ribbon protein
MKTSLTSTSLRFAGIFAGVTFALIAYSAPPEASQPTGNAPKDALNASKPDAKNAAAATRDTISEAWEKTKDATFKQREVVRERMKGAEASLDAKIVEWTAKKETVSDEAKPAVDAAHKEVREAREVLSQKINALDNATEETWNSVKAELNTAWQRMVTAVSDLTAKLQS